MRIEALDSRELSVAGECLRAAADGPFFPDWEFTTLFGLTREDVRAVADLWPAIEDGDLTEVALLGALNNLSGYPIDHHVDWSKWISEPPRLLVLMMAKLRGEA